ncbi:MAG: glycosyltransferase family 2 protein [Acidobacteria bacterium]|nr:glycosyltransferase family 2 protein [Acidobacteriota bacterium]
MLAQVTPLVLTYNEAPNLDRTLAMLQWAARIVVVDSGSADGTLEICRRYPAVDVFARAFDGFAAQRNFGLDQVRTAWVLSLDADYVLTPEAIEELRTLLPDERTTAYHARMTYCVFGRPLRGSLYPPRIVLFRRDRARYVPDGHSERLEFTGASGWLRAGVRHDDRKPLERWWADQWRYASQEAQHLLDSPAPALTTIDRIRRRTPFAPAVVLAYGLIWRGLAFDGWAGCYYLAQRMLAELLLLAQLVDRRLRPSSAAVETPGDRYGRTR